MGRVASIWSDERVRFLLVGGLNTAIGYLIFAGLWYLFSGIANYLVIATVAHFVAVTIAFSLYRRHVFMHRGRWFAAFIRYNVAVGGNLALGLLLMLLFVRGMGLHPLLAQAIAIVIVAFSNYLTHKFFSFGRFGEPRDEH